MSIVAKRSLISATAEHLYVLLYLCRRLVYLSFSRCGAVAGGLDIDAVQTRSMNARRDTVDKTLI